MAKKLHIQGDFFEGYFLLGIVCGLPDFRVTHFINQNCHLHLKKYSDFSLQEKQVPGFSWYCFCNEELRRDYYFIQNKNGTDFLLTSLRNFDYFLLVYGNTTKQYKEELINTLRKMSYITAVFEQNLNRLKNGAWLIERNELHAPGRGTQ